MYEIPYNKSIMKEWRDFGFKRGQQSCAASPWTYRTDTGDETGKVVESAELPEKGKGGWFIAWWDYGRYTVFTIEYDSDFDGIFYVDRGGQMNEDYLRKHLIAWAEIRR